MKIVEHKDEDNKHNLNQKEYEIDQPDYDVVCFKDSQV